MVTITATGDRFGAYVDGIDAGTVPEGRTLAALQAALDKHLVLTFRRRPAPATDSQVVAFCSAFGALRPSLADRSRLPDYPAINLVANRNVGDVHGSGGNAALHFHSDLHHEPPLIEFIYLDALRVPDDGGATVWVDLRAAYDDLTDDTKTLLDGLTVRYGLREDLDFDRYFKASAEGLAARPQSTEVGLVQTNARTGRKSLWPNAGPQSNHTASIVGMDPDEGRALLTDLFDHCTQERYRYRHQWQAGEACLWHNIQSFHGREAFPDSQVRVMRHLNILGITDPHQLS